MLKKYLLVSLLFFPLAANAACNCCEEEEEDDGEYRPYSYIGLKGGTNHVVDITSVTMGSDSGYGIYAGKRYTELFAVEAEYSYLGKYETAAGVGHTTAASIAGVHQLNIGFGEILGKLGIAHTHTAINGSGANKVDLTYGIGWEFELNRDLRLRFSHDRYRVQLQGANGDTLDTFSHIGIAYRY